MYKLKKSKLYGIAFAAGVAIGAVNVWDFTRSHDIVNPWWAQALSVLCMGLVVLLVIAASRLPQMMDNAPRVSWPRRLLLWAVALCLAVAMGRLMAIGDISLPEDLHLPSRPGLAP